MIMKMEDGIIQKQEELFMKHTFRRILAAVTAMGCTAALLPAGIAHAELLEEAKVIYETDFEDGDASKFSPRGEDDTSVLTVGEDEDAGSKVLNITGRTQGWNGPQLRLDEICEPSVRYTVSVKAKAAWYNSVKVSLQYTADGAEKPIYGNLQAKQSQGEWVSFENIKFSIPAGVHDIYIYVEGDDKADLAIDDFSLKTAPVYGIEEDIPGLKDVYADYFKIGTAVTEGELAPKSTQQLILKHFNSLTPGNELKPENMLDQAACQALAADGDNTQVAVSLKSNARSILNFARDNNIPVRGHTLVWHSQTPGWFFKEDYTLEGDWVDEATMRQRMENYIKGVMEAIAEDYPDVEFYAWDVVNEAWTDGGTPRDGGTYDEDRDSSGWVKVYGDNSFIKDAFTFARKYAPKGCKLYYNDFNEYIQGKTEAVIKMATELKADGLIDGIGLQSHLNVMNYGSEEPFPMAVHYGSALDKYCETGLDIQITELDATLAQDVPVTDELLELQAKYYSDIMDAIVRNKDSISAVVFWGTTDDQSWRAWGSPLLFDEFYTAKPCFHSIIDGIEYTIPEPTQPKPTEPKPTDPEPTDPTGNDKIIIRWGDVNEDGAVTILDVITLNKSLMVGEKLTEQGKINANVDNKGDAPDETDSLNILKYVVEILHDFEDLWE